MWSIYVVLSGVLTVVLMFEGMSLYDALCHSFGTMATGGFSTYNSSIGYFQSPLIEATIILFMILAGTNFALYYAVIHSPRTPLASGRLSRFAVLYRDAEYRVYLMILLCSTCVIALSLWAKRNLPASGYGVPARRIYGRFNHDHDGLWDGRFSTMEPVLERLAVAADVHWWLCRFDWAVASR